MVLDWMVVAMVVGPADKLPETTLLETTPEAEAPVEAVDPEEAQAPASTATTAATPATDDPATEEAVDAGGTPFEPRAPEQTPKTPASVGITATAPAPRPDKPIRWRLDASLGAAATWVNDDAFLGLSESPSVLGAAPMVRFDWRLRPSGYLFVGGGLMYRGTRRAGSIHETLGTRLRIDEPVVFARFSLMPVEGFDVFADLGVGPSFAYLEVDGPTFETFASQRNVLVTADLMAGVALYLPKTWLPRKGASRVTAGVSGSLGYTIRNPLRIDPELDLEDDALPTDTVPLGDVAMRGLSWRAGLFIRFM